MTVKSNPCPLQQVIQLEVLNVHLVVLRKTRQGGDIIILTQNTGNSEANSLQQHASQQSCSDDDTAGVIMSSIRSIMILTTSFSMV